MKKFGLFVMPLMAVSLLVSCGGSKPQVVEHFVTFDSKGGSHIDTLRVKDNGTISPPTNPTFAGHDFKGWYITNPDPIPIEKDKYNFSNKVTSDLTLYAYWQEVGVTYHTFTLDGANCSIYSDPNFETQIKDGESAKFTILPNAGYNSPRNEGDVIITGSNTTYENSIITISSMTDDVVVDAISRHQDYVISYSGVNCKAGNQIVTDAYSLQTTWSGEGDDYVFNLTVDNDYSLPNKISVLFNGTEGTNGTDYVYSSDNKTLTLKTRATITIKVVANPDTPVVTTYTVTFDAGPGGKFLNNEQKISFKLDRGTELLSYIRQLSVPTLEGHTFAYYEYEEKDNAIDYDDVVTSDITLKANYFASSTPKTDDLTQFDWKTIKNISVTGNPSQWFKIGATKKVYLKEQDSPHTVRIIGFNHDYSELPDDGSNPDPSKVLGITFEFANVITKSNGDAVTTIWDGEYQKSGDNFDYRKSTLNDFLNNDVLNMLPSSGDPNNPDLKEVIKPVDKKVGVNKSKKEGSQYYTATSFDGEDYPYPYLFPLSHDEMTDNESWVTEGEGTKYQYYVEHPNREDRIKRKAGIETENGEYYWFRSPYTDLTDIAWRVGDDGDLHYVRVYNYAYGAAPAFCI